jgi:hypothetical protein
MALHIVRTPAFGLFLGLVTEDAIINERRRGRVPPESFDAVASFFRGPRMHAHALLGLIARIGSLLCAMRWVLVRFVEDVLVTSDQPVVTIPLTPPGRPESARVVPPGGFLDTLEVRFSLDPRTLLLLSWSEEEDAREAYEGTFAQAREVNCSVSYQADREWFYRPGTVPQRLIPPWLEPRIVPLAPQLLSGYDVQVAERSSRRRAADLTMTRMISEDAPRDVMRWPTLP